MSKQTRYNRLLFLMTLSICIGSVLAGSVSQASAQSAAPEANTYNKRPLIDFRDKLVSWRENGNDLYQPFEYSLEGTVDKDGKLLVEKTPVFKGDPKVQEIVKGAVAAFSDTGLLKPLKDLQTTNVKISLNQDGKQFDLKLEILQNSEVNANKLSSALNLVIVAAKIKNQNEADDETYKLLQLTKIDKTDKVVVITTIVPNQFAEEMYQKYKKDAVKRS